MPDLYRLLSGTIVRREHDPNEPEIVITASYEAPYDFVPSPGELAANEFRLRRVKSVSDKDPRVADAILNTNLEDQRAQRRLAALSSARRAAAKNVAALSATLASNLINKASTEDELDRYLEQESQRRPTSRKTVIRAIELKRAEFHDEEDE